MAVVNESVARVAAHQAFPLETPRVDKAVQTRPVRKFNMVSMAACIVFAIAAFWFVAGVGAKIDATNYRIDQLQTQINLQNAENASLTAQVNSLKEPSRILGIALQNGEKYANPVNIKVSTKH